MKTWNSLMGVSCVAALCAVVVGSAIAADGQHVLRFDPKPGAYSYLMTVKQDTDFTAGPMGTQSTSTEQSLGLTYAVDGPMDDGIRRMAVTYDRFAMDIDIMGQKMAFDTAAPSEGDDPIMKGIAGIIGKSFSVDVSPTNEVVAVTGTAEVLDAVLQPSGNAQVDAQMRQVFSQTINDGAMKQMLQQSMAVFPQTPLALGETWTSNLSSPTPLGEMSFASTFTLQSVEERGGRPCYKLKQDIEIKPQGGQSPMLQQMTQVFAQQDPEAEFEISFEGSTGSGTLWIEKGTGLLIDMTMNQILGMNMRIASEGKPPADLALKVDIATQNRLVN